MAVVPVSCCKLTLIRSSEHTSYRDSLKFACKRRRWFPAIWVVRSQQLQAPATDSREPGVLPPRARELRPEWPGDVMRSTPMRATPPWTLHGRAYVFPFRLPETAAVARCTAHNSPPDAHNLLTFVGGYGGYIVCDYHDSPVGPYKELVFVPGAYDYYDTSTGRSSRGRSVVSIWVDNEKSKSNGRSNWGIPKELAEFKWTESSNSSQPTRITVRRPSTTSSEGDMIIDLVINDKYSPISIPIRTKLPLLPIDLLDFIPLIQIPDDEAPYLLKTRLSVSGWVKPAALVGKPRVDSTVLPSIESLYGFAISSLELVFKKPMKVDRRQS